MARYVVLHVMDSEPGFMATYRPQVATIQDYESLAKAATFNVGTYPEARVRGKPYRVIVIPEEHWIEMEVYVESQRGRDRFVAYINQKNRTIS